MAVITVVLADDHPMWRSGVRADLGDGFAVIGEADDAPSAIEAIRRRRPEVTVCDLHMPGGGGLAVVKACADITKILMLTVSDQEQDLLDCVAAGAAGYLLKNTPGADLRDAVTRVAEGDAVFSPTLASLVLAEFRRIAAASNQADPLSGREREVLQLVARGYTYREVGEKLYISPRTAENHVRNILGKLHLTRRSDLIRYATERGLD